MNLSSNKQINQLDIISQPSADGVKDIPNMKVKKKSRKQIKRLCKVCLIWFPTSRSDAKYCSHSCRQKAYHKGTNFDEFDFYNNPGEHIYFEAIKMLTSSILDQEGQTVKKSTFDDWMKLYAFNESLFNRYLPENSQMAIDHNHYMKIFIRHVSPTFRQYDFNEITLEIPEDCYEAWSGIKHIII